MDWTASESATLAERRAGERHERRHDHGHAVDHRAGGRDLHGRRDGHRAPGATGSPKTIPVTLTVDPPAPPALSVSPASLAFSGDAGGANPAAQDVAVTNTGSGTLDVDRVRRRDAG